MFFLYYTLNVHTKKWLAKAPKEKLDPIFKPEVFEGDARNLSFLEDSSVDLVCTQQPYWNAVKYSKYRPNDLSHIKDERKFCEEFKAS